MNKFLKWGGIVLGVGAVGKVAHTIYKKNEEIESLKAELKDARDVRKVLKDTIDTSNRMALSLGYKYGRTISNRIANAQALVNK